PAFGRLTQTLVASVSSRDYVDAARVAGVGRFRILLRHVLPNISEPLVVNATITAGAALLAFAGLSFLGLGVQQPSYDYDRLLFDGIPSIYVNPASALAPGAAVLIAGLAFNLFGESVAKGLGVGVVAGLPELPSMAATLDGDERPVEETSHVGGDLVLDVRDLEVTFPGPDGPIRPVRGVSF
ncbi:ABC transporter permease subunit, partial [Nocardioides hankookensis]